MRTRPGARGRDEESSDYLQTLLDENLIKYGWEEDVWLVHLGTVMVSACWNSVLTMLQGMSETRAYEGVHHHPDLVMWYSSSMSTSSPVHTFTCG